MKNKQEISIKKYRQIKLKIRALEETNYDAIYVVPCSGNQNWREVTEHSALIYYYEVCQKLQRRVKFCADTLSFYDQYKIGYIRTLGVDTVRENLKKTGLYKSESEEAEVHVFYLTKRFTKHKMQQLEKAEMARRQENMMPIPAGALNPVLYQLLVRQSTEIYKLCIKRLDRLTRQTNGAIMMKIANGMLESYHLMAMAKNAPRGKMIRQYGEMRKQAYLLLLKVQVMGEIRIWDLETCSHLAELVKSVRDLVEQELKKLLKEERNGTSGSGKDSERN